jgi:acetylornithine deacetylase
MLLPDPALLERLVSFDTVSGGANLPLVEWIADYLDRPGIRVIPQAGPREGTANLVVTAGPETGAAGGAAPSGAAGGRDLLGGLTLCGHLDVVPADGGEWETDPFRMVERDGLYIGRGTCDMKGFCALAINRMASVDPDALGRPLALLLTFDEEVGCLGAHHFVRTWPRDRPLPRHVIVGEPTSLRAVRLHKGHARLRLRIRGKAAHTGTPHLGVNAVETAGPVLDALAALRRELEAEPSPHAADFAEAPHTVLAVTGIRGGEATNIVPPSCEIDVGVRLMPGSDPEALTARIRRRVEALAGPASIELETVGVSPPMLTPEDAPLYRAVCERVDQSETLGVAYASDGGWLSSAGYECVLFGPGSMDVAHRPGEHLAAHELREAGVHLDALVATMCGNPVETA